MVAAAVTSEPWALDIPQRARGGLLVHDGERTVVLFATPLAS